MSAMPIYEFACTACGRRFEDLVRADGPAPRCPSCGEPRVERLISTFVAGIARADSASLPLAGGGCCGGGCGCHAR
jgi:putative FmdB family regulatory protein